MTTVDDVARSLNTVGAAAWFGGSLVGVAGLARSSDVDSLRHEDEIWRRWTPVQNAAIAGHLIGSVRLAFTNKGRVASQRGVGRVAGLKAAVTIGALAATAYASMEGRNVARELSRSDSDDADQGQIDEQLAARLRKLRIAQTAVPVLTGAILVLDSRLGEQQRPVQVVKGVAQRMLPDAVTSLPDALSALPDALSSLPGTLSSSLPDALPSLPDALHALPDAAHALSDAAGALPDQIRDRLHR